MRARLSKTLISRRFSMTNTGVRIWACLAFASAVLATPEAHAETVSTTGKGLVGGGLLGAEVVVISEALIGLDQEWMYWAGAGVGAAGGAVGGYFLESSMSPQVSVVVLMGGMALAIPALVISLDATRRHWPDAPAPQGPRELPSNPPDPGSRPELVFDIPSGARGVVDWSPEGLAWALPDVYLTNTYTPVEQWTYGLPQQTKYQVPLLSARF